MSGIVFLKTADYERIKSFYIDEIGMEIWQKQAECIILKHGNLLVGFCEGEKAETEGCYTFFYDTKEEVDEKYGRFKNTAKNEPEVNERYNIYNFFAEDPEGRTLEFQTFLHSLNPYIDGDELLRNRRSVRKYKDKEIPEETLRKVIDNCRFAPSSKNSQPVYYRIIKEEKKLNSLGNIRRGQLSAPIKKAPCAVGIVSDPDCSTRHIQDGCIGAYHFTLAARIYGLGTCWIADMDRKEVKDILEVPENHYVATVTPVGFPEDYPDAPPRNPVNDYIR